MKHNLLLTFLFAGTIGTLTMFVSSSPDRMKNHPLALVVKVGIPTGLIYLLFLDHPEAIAFSYVYAYVLAILAIASMFFYLMSKHTQLSKEHIMLYTFALWILLALIRYKIQE